MKEVIFPVWQEWYSQCAAIQKSRHFLLATLQQLKVPFSSLLAKHPLQPTNDSHVGHLLKGLNWWLFVPCVTGWCWFPNSLEFVQSGWCQPSAAGSDATAPSLPLKLWMQLTKILWCAHGSPDELSSSQNLICAWQSSGGKKKYNKIPSSFGDRVANSALICCAHCWRHVNDICLLSLCWGRSRGRLLSFTEFGGGLG